MSTADLVRQAGFLAVLATLLLTLTVVTLRLLALPPIPILIVLVLDRAADLLLPPCGGDGAPLMALGSRPLSFTGPRPSPMRQVS